MLSAPVPFSNEPPVNARPLFAPSADELRREAGQAAARAIAKREYLAKAEARTAIDEALARWRDKPDGKHAAELLRVTAENGLDGDFTRAAREIIEYSKKPGISGLASTDLADLLSSHIQLLSTLERGSGEVFWLKQEIARLRSGNRVL